MHARRRTAAAVRESLASAVALLFFAIITAGIALAAVPRMITTAIRRRNEPRKHGRHAAPARIQLRKRGTHAAPASPVTRWVPVAATILGSAAVLAVTIAGASGPATARADLAAVALANTPVTTAPLPAATGTHPDAGTHRVISVIAPASAAPAIVPASVAPVITRPVVTAHQLAPAVTPASTVPAVTPASTAPSAPVPDPGSTGPVSTAGMSAYEQCVISHESSGNAATWDPPYWGLFQFIYATWVHYGGAPSAYGNASAAVQEQVFATAIADGGAGNWAGDGCVYTSTTAVVASPGPPPVNDGNTAARALAWAETQAGVPYVWGGDGPGGYDCSGLVQAAYEHADVQLPRDTYEMLATVGTLLIPTSDPQPGDLAFFGSGHVEIYVRPGVTFGAQQPGTLVGFHDYDAAQGYAPTAFYRVA
jgi:cell wall-associated NlpC family hydrolase